MEWELCGVDLHGDGSGMTTWWVYIAMGICWQRYGVPLAEAATSIFVVATEVNLCCDKHDKTLLLSRQKYACRDKTFVNPNIFLSQQT